MVKKIGLILLTLTLGGGAFLLYNWRQATQLPNWYIPSADLPIEHPDPETLQAKKKRLVSRPNTEITDQTVEEQAKPLANQPVETDRAVGVQANPLTNQPVETDQAVDNPANPVENQPVEVELTAEEFNTLVAAEPTVQKVLQLTKGFNTTIEDGVVESGFVINLSNLPMENLDSQEQEVLQQVMQIFPGLETQDFYIGIEGQPRIEQGQLRWDETTQFKVGGLSFSLNDVAQQLGLSPEQLQQLISLELGEVNPGNAELPEQRVLIRGAAD
ncbi:MAG: hypothetical protein QNJ46_19255 [Leptolyngbyaceae cyanobacterium MO_188.B28]|nr:hypothetical protein [Leptolyngbyaceae cyanobacterium MO_188.B28]